MRSFIIGLVGAASLASGVLAPEAKAGNYERALALENQWLAECGGPKDLEYQSYGEAMLDHRPATPVPPMSPYCNRLYEELRRVNPYLPATPPETYEQAFAKAAFLQDKWMKECDPASAMSDILSALIAGRPPPDTAAQSKYCDLLYQNAQQANQDFEIAKQNSDELLRTFLENERQR